MNNVPCCELCPALRLFLDIYTPDFVLQKYDKTYEVRPIFVIKLKYFD